MTAKLIRTIVAAILVVLFVASAFMKIYFVRDNSGGTVFWKEDEAYLFLGSGHTGYHVTYLEYPLVVTLAYFHVGHSASDQKTSTIVLRVTPAGVERHILNYSDSLLGSSPSYVTPFEDGLYASCPGGVLCKWTGDGFAPATEAERQRHGGASGLVRDDAYNPANGWSVQHFGLGKIDYFEARVGKNLKISVKTLAIYPPGVYSWNSVDLVNAGQPPESLYNVDGKLRRVSGAEYEAVFGKR
jgi:hypothetical protein